MADLVEARLGAVGPQVDGKYETNEESYVGCFSGISNSVNNSYCISILL